MASAPVGPLAQVKLPSGPAPTTAEQRYWRSFRKPVLFPSPTGYAVSQLSAAADLLAVTTGARIQLYSSRSRALVKTLTRFADVARCGDVRPDGRVLAAGDDGGLVQVFDLASRAVLRSWNLHRQPVWVTRWSPSSPTRLLTASDDRSLRLWDLPSQEPTMTLTGHQDYVRCARFMPGTMSDMLLSGSYDATVRLWDPRAGPAAGPVMTFKHSHPVEDVLPLPSGTTVLAASGNAVSVLDLVAARPLRLLANHQKTVTSLALASAGRRLLAAGLDGHLKVFETSGWNVVNNSKYPSPLLAVCLVSAPAADGQAEEDRHLAVGMQSGLLSIRTRLSGPEAVRERDRDREMAALLAGDIASLDAKRALRKRKLASSKRLDLAGEGAEVVIANEARSATRRARERGWQKDLRLARYPRALDRVLDRADPQHSSLDVLTLLLALRHRGAVRDALESRDEHTIQPLLHWLCRHVCDPRYVSVCVEVALHLLDLYAEYVGASASLHDAFRTLHRRVKVEVESAQVACQMGGMLESLARGAS